MKLVYGLVLWATIGAQAETRTFDVLDVIKAVPVNANTAAIAACEGFELTPLQFGTAATRPQTGDSVTALVSLSSFDGRVPPSQWIIRLRLAAATAEERANLKNQDVTYQANTGDAFTFRSGLTAMELESLGPIGRDTKPDLRRKPKRSRIFVLTDFLALDLTRTADVLFRIGREAGKHVGEGSFQLSARPEPYSEATVQAARRNLAPLQFTSDDIRSFAGSLPALQQFLDIVRNTPDLQTILWQVLDKPSLVDVFRHGSSRAIHFEYIGGGPSAPAAEFFLDKSGQRPCGILFFKLDVFEKPVLTVMLVVTTPQPPLLVSAGIVGLAAFSPSKPDKVVTVRVLSSTLGEGVAIAMEPSPLPGKPSAGPR